MQATNHLRLLRKFTPKQAWTYVSGQVQGLSESIARERLRGRRSPMAYAIMERHALRLNQQGPQRSYPSNPGLLFGTNAIDSGHGNINVAISQKNKFALTSFDYDKLNHPETQAQIIRFLPDLLTNIEVMVGGMNGSLNDDVAASKWPSMLLEELNAQAPTEQSKCVLHTSMIVDPMWYRTLTKDLLDTPMDRLYLGPSLFNLLLITAVGIQWAKLRGTVFPLFFHSYSCQLGASLIRSICDADPEAAKHLKIALHCPAQLPWGQSLLNDALENIRCETVVVYGAWDPLTIATRASPKSITNPNVSFLWSWTASHPLRHTLPMGIHWALTGQKKGEWVRPLKE